MKTVAARLATLLVLTCVVGIAAAHEVRPGYLEISEVKPGVYDVLWKVPARGDLRLALYAHLPAECTGATNAGAFVGGAFVSRWRASCPGGLVGQRIAVDGLSATRTDVLVRVAHLGGVVQTTRLTPESPAFEVAAVPTAGEVSSTYFGLGVEHILLGIDHLLFVLGLLLLVGNWRRLIVTVTAFTVAHSITLAAATLGFVHVPQAPVEAVIALSVMFVAAEILRAAHGRTSLTARVPWVVAFVFGLLHGLGFAGALREVGLPQTDIPLALLFFNVGVEVGQLAFIAAVVAVLAVIARLSKGTGVRARGTWQAEALVRAPLAYLIGCTAAYWTIDRTIGFF
ncbi:MAG TPA: HupE/UreJ family protein [Steroidobacteraceae bacterium]|nr:HupE/UreJ family protein [Steroidobacteraceae bacterium]